jgi:hypothetical protein
MQPLCVRHLRSCCNVGRVRRIAVGDFAHGDRSALYAGIIAATLLAGCGGSQPPGAIAQTSVIAVQGERGKSWMLPEAKNEALLYTSTEKGVYITS